MNIAKKAAQWVSGLIEFESDRNVREMNRRMKRRQAVERGDLQDIREIEYKSRFLTGKTPVALKTDSVLALERRVSIKK
jgi:hypothetical protein